MVPYNEVTGRSSGILVEWETTTCCVEWERCCILYKCIYVTL